MKRYVIVLLCITLLTGCQTFVGTQGTVKTKTVHRVEKQMPPIDFIPEDISIVSIGDSLTKGVGDERKLGGYIPYLKKQLESSRAIDDVEFASFGVTGNRSDQLLKRLKQEKIKTAIQKADMIIITIGGNDVMKVFKDNLLGLQLDVFTKAENGYGNNLKEIIEIITSYNNHSEIILLGIYNPFIKWFSDIKEMSEIVTNWNDTSKSIISQFDQASFVPVDDIFRNNEEFLLHTDYFHPNNYGYELMANRIFEHIEREHMLKMLFEQ